jgi:hypothetical protein
MLGRGLVNNYRISERKAQVEAFYTGIIEPASEHCMKKHSMLINTT